MTLCLNAEKANFNQSDIFTIFCAWFCPFTAWTMNWSSFNLSSNKEFGFCMLTLSCLSFCFFIGSLLYKSFRSYSYLKDELDAPSSALLYMVASVSLRNITSTVLMSFTFPAFPLAYFASLFGIIDDELMSIIISLLNFYSKVIFIKFLMDGHLEAYDPLVFKATSEKKANDARRTFLRYIFHEIRSPINSLSLGLEVLKDVEPGNDISKTATTTLVDTLSIMRESVSYMTDVLRDVLDIQNLDEGVLELSFDKFVIDDLLMSVLRKFCDFSKSKQIKISVEIADDVPQSVWGDAEKVRHVLSNILCNSIKFSDVGSKIWIVISVEDGCTKFLIRDEGELIPEDIRSTVFVPYAVLNGCDRPGTNSTLRGSDIALVVSSEIVKLHNGVIGCTISDGNHNVFYFMIPFENDSDYELISPLEREKIMSSYLESHGFEKLGVPPESCVSVNTFTAPTIHTIVDDPGHHKATLLKIAGDDGMPDERYTMKNQGAVVDDVPSNRKMLGMFLKREGQTCDFACDGVEAVALILANQNKYDFVFMDNMMPNMNGIQATKTLREAGYDKIIVGLTGNTLEIELIDFQNAGADYVFSKPFKMQQFEIILEYMKRFGTKTTWHFRHTERHKESLHYVIDHGM